MCLIHNNNSTYHTSRNFCGMKLSWLQDFCNFIFTVPTELFMILFSRITCLNLLFFHGCRVVCIQAGVSGIILTMRPI